MPDNVYGPTRKFCDTILKRFGVATRYYDPLSASLASSSATQTRAILLESPGSLTMEVQDVPAICAVARERGIVTLIDNTWATPLLFPAIAAGVDISHPRGNQICRRPCRRDARRGRPRPRPITSASSRPRWDLGHSVSPDDAWLGSRGPADHGGAPQAARGERAQDRPMAEGAAAGRRGASPGPARLPRPRNLEARLQGLVGPVLVRAARRDDARAPPSSTGSKLFGIGYSWGGYESLAMPVDPYRTVSKPPAPNLVRLHIGLEDPDDLIEDLGGLAFEIVMGR